MAYVPGLFSTSRSGWLDISKFATTMALHLLDRNTGICYWAGECMHACIGNESMIERQVCGISVSTMK